jgi:DNA-binding beta-propeller fold protein YncE
MKMKFLGFVSSLLLVSVSLCFAAGPARTGETSSRANATEQNNPSPALNIEVENWTRPQPGWLYVLDPRPDDSRPGGRIWLVEPAGGKVMGSIRTGDNADFALSPDGARLYVAAVTEGDASEMAIIDTARGVVVKSGTVNDRAVSDGLPAFSTMDVSPDGSALRILISTSQQDRDDFLLATFDTNAGEFLPGVVHLGNCGPGRFITHTATDHFAILCPRTNKVRFIQVDGESHPVSPTQVDFPWVRRDGVAEVIDLPGSDYFAIVRGDGGVVAMNIKTHDFWDTAEKSGSPNRVPPAAWPVSPDGTRVYLGHREDYNAPADKKFYLDYGRPPNVRPDNETADELRVFDTHTWKKVATIRTKMPFWSATVGSDGNVLYAMSPLKHSILVIDTAKNRQIRTLKVGGAPSLAIVAK